MKMDFHNMLLIITPLFLCIGAIVSSASANNVTTAEKERGYGKEAKTIPDVLSNDFTYTLYTDISGNVTIFNTSVLEYTTVTTSKRGQRLRSRRGPPIIPNQELLDILDRIVLPVALCLGIVGNLLIFPVFVYSPLKANSLSHFLAAVSVADFIHINACLVMGSEHQGLTLYHTIGVCQMTNFFKKISEFLTTWYLFAAHVQRFMVHFESICARPWCTTFRSKFIIIFVFVFSLVGYLHEIWTNVLIERRGKARCARMADSLKHLFQLWKIEAIGAFFLPMLLMVIIDVTILLHFVANRYKLYFRVPSKNRSIKCDSGQDELGEYALASQRHRSGSHPKNKHGEESGPPPPEFNLNLDKKSSTFAVVLCGIIFIALVLPSYVNNTKLNFSPKMPSPAEMLAMQICEKLLRLNGVYKFLLYVCVSRPFRMGLGYLFKCQGRKRPDENKLQETTEV